MQLHLVGNCDSEILTDNGKFPGLSTPDESYHGMVYTRDAGKAAFLTKARVQLMRIWAQPLS